MGGSTRLCVTGRRRLDIATGFPSLIARMFQARSALWSQDRCVSRAARRRTTATNAPSSPPQEVLPSARNPPVQTSLAAAWSACDLHHVKPPESLWLKPILFVIVTTADTVSL